MNILTINLPTIIKCTRECTWCYLGRHLTKRTRTNSSVDRIVRKQVKGIKDNIRNDRIDILYLSLPFSSNINSIVHAINKYTNSLRGAGITVYNKRIIGQPVVIKLIQDYGTDKLGLGKIGRDVRFIINISNKYDISYLDKVSINNADITITEYTSNGTIWDKQDIHNMVNILSNEVRSGILDRNRINITVESLFINGRPLKTDMTKEIVSELKAEAKRRNNERYLSIRTSGCYKYINRSKAECNGCILNNQHINAIETTKDGIIVGCPYRMR